MISGLAALLLLLSVAGDLCGLSGVEQALLAELNAARRAAGQEPLTPHPVLCNIARDEAAAVPLR